MNHTDSLQRKQELRATVRQRRRAISEKKRDFMDQRIRQHLLDRFQELDPGCVAAFVAFDGEPNLRPALQQWDLQGIRVALPVLTHDRPSRLSMRLWRTGTHMLQNAFGIAEPADTACLELPDIDILLMPLVAYDPAGTRLGMGGGYYDQLLEGQGPLTRPLRVGVAYSTQKESSLPRESWDVPLHALVNENGWLSFPPAQLRI